MTAPLGAPLCNPAMPAPPQSAHPLAYLPDTLAPGADRDQAVADLAHILAHRLRGPLTSIQCYTEMLTDELGTPEEREMALRIIESAAAIERMLADLQRYSFSLTPVLRGLDARGVAEGVLAGVDERGASVQLVVEDETEVAADPVLLQQALLILLHNALDAVGEAALEVRRGVRLTIRRTASGDVCFDVWNAGSVGVDAQRVFDPFFTTKSQNLGIGLSIARRIAVAHGGRLSVAEAAGGEAGITFTLLLPAVTNGTV